MYNSKLQSCALSSLLGGPKGYYIILYVNSAKYGHSPETNLRKENWQKWKLSSEKFRTMLHLYITFKFKAYLQIRFKGDRMINKLNILILSYSNSFSIGYRGSCYQQRKKYSSSQFLLLKLGLAKRITTKTFWPMHYTYIEEHF